MFSGVVFSHSAHTQDAGGSPTMFSAVTWEMCADESCTLAAGNGPRQQLLTLCMCADCPAGCSTPQCQALDCAPCRWTAVSIRFGYQILSHLWEKGLCKTSNLWQNLIEIGQLILAGSWIFMQNGSVTAQIQSDVFAYPFFPPCIRSRH